MLLRVTQKGVNIDGKKVPVGVVLDIDADETPAFLVNKVVDVSQLADDMATTKAVDEDEDDEATEAAAKAAADEAAAKAAAKKS